MTDVTASGYEIPGFDRRVFFLADTRRIVRLGRSLVRFSITGLTAVATVAAGGVGVTYTAAWILNSTVASNPHVRAPVLAGPAALALVEQAPQTAATFDGRWAQSMTAMGFQPVSPRALAAAEPVPTPRPRPVIAQREPAAEFAHGLTQVARLGAPAPRIALPLPRPHIEPPVGQAASRIALALPPVAATAEKNPEPRIARTKQVPLPVTDGRTAVYDIAAHMVILPNGERLEAHSGLGEKMDDPRYVNVRMRGATPPNVYNLTLREEIFHGVRAIRLNPVNEDKMYGRAGILAHTYMLGPNGQSNGCVSFRHYDRFLQAFLNGEVDRLVVVASRGPGARVADATPAAVDRFAANY